MFQDIDIETDIWFHFICILYCLQVRLGTRRGSKAVKVTVITLYVLAFALGLINALPFTSIVSPFNQYGIWPHFGNLAVHFFVSSSFTFCMVEHSFYTISSSLFLIHGLFQLLCAFTLPMGKVFVTYVEDNHKVSDKLVRCLKLLCFWSNCYIRYHNHGVG